MKYVIMLLSFLLVLLLSSCSTSGAGTDLCVIIEPILISQEDVLTEGTARQILLHNEFYERVCVTS
jgi:hypothetical protein